MGETQKKLETQKEGNKPSFEVKSLAAHAAFNGEKTGEENLGVLISVTRDGGSERIDADSAELLKELILQSDINGYFSGGKAVSAYVSQISSVKIENGFVSFADKNGVFRLGGFPLRADLVEKILENKVHKKQVASLLKLQTEIHGEMPEQSQERKEKIRGFKQLDGGNYEIGSLTNGMKIPESGKDFHDQTGAGSISFAETRAGTSITESHHANWSAEKNCYIDVDSGTKVILKNGFHYLITPQIETYQMPDGKVKTRSEIRYEIAKQQFADRAGRLMYYFKNFMDNVYKEQGGRVIDDSTIARVKNDSGYYAQNVGSLNSYTPDGVSDSVFSRIDGMQLPHDVVVKKLSSESKEVKRLAVQIPDLGVFEVSCSEHVIRVTENNNVVCRFDDREKEASGDMKRFVKFSEALNVAMNKEWIEQKNSATVSPEDAWRAKNVQDIYLGE